MIILGIKRRHYEICIVHFGDGGIYICNLIGFGIGFFFLIFGGLFLYVNTKDDPKSLRLISLLSFEGGAILLGLLIVLMTTLPILGIGTGTCESDFFN